MGAAALKAVGAWATSILESSDDARLLKPMLPAMLQVCGRAVAAEDRFLVRERALAVVCIGPD